MGLFVLIRRGSRKETFWRPRPLLRLGTEPLFVARSSDAGHFFDVRSALDARVALDQPGVHVGTCNDPFCKRCGDAAG